ncbi:MAG: hypothetical protein U5N56_13530 [Candidatus Marinimicrobia bacterium]|nr:hypothetical protein [Candidatus Neomarinimicrobiota bacterium]
MKITEAAIKEFKNTLDDNGAKNSGIRIALSAGCCGPLFGLESCGKR